MTAKRPLKGPAVSAGTPEEKPISAAEYPALRSFLRGYFHQDMKDEYGSVEEAVREFCEDADDKERAEVGKQWMQFLDRTKGKPIEEVNRLLTRELGSSYAITADDIQQISQSFKPGRKS